MLWNLSQERWRDGRGSAHVGIGAASGLEAITSNIFVSSFERRAHTIYLLCGDRAVQKNRQEEMDVKLLSVHSAVSSVAPTYYSQWFKEQDFKKSRNES